MNNTQDLKEYIQKNGQLTFSNVGASMLPMLRENRDLFTVRKKPEERLKKYDVVLYIRPPHKYVLHRIIKVRENDYVILGDNCEKKEYGITDDDIIGVLVSFVRNGKTYTVNNKCYKIYYHIRHFLYPLRIIKFKLKRIIKKMIRK